MDQVSGGPRGVPGGLWGGFGEASDPPCAPPQYLNIKLTDISVTDPEKYPHMVRGLGSGGSWGGLRGFWGGSGWGGGGLEGSGGYLSDFGRVSVSSGDLGGVSQ